MVEYVDAKRVPYRTVEARSFSLRLRGLMFRSAWPGEWSAVHFPRCRSVHTFFTNLRFDLVFLDRGARVTRCVEQTGLFRLYFGPSRTVDTLEMPEGAIRRMDLKVGDRLEW